VSFTIILPTFNESNNVGVLINQIFEVFEDLDDFHILVIDDQSTDGTQTEVTAISNVNNKVKLFVRDNPDGLTGAIKYGISITNTKYVGWMDADGSMPASALLKLWTAFDSETDLTVGSRFIIGGGFKGVTEKSRNFISVYKNLKQSNDSIVAMLLSRILNKFLRLILTNRVKDLTSGFIIIRRNKLNLLDLQGYYGEYCPVFLYKCFRRDLKILEVPYINQPRKFGESKTGTNLITLIKRGIPYITSAVKVRLEKFKF
jgi:dolichol-phosphate mannosyltransferase